jgi:predicted DNA-binding transcriptional regulator AlpA
MSRGSVGRSKLPLTAKLETHLTVEDLIGLGIAASRQTIYYWVRERDFPPGHLMGPKRRCWTVSEIDRWLKTRPTEPALGIGRPRKNPKESNQRKRTAVEVGRAC